MVQITEKTAAFSCAPGLFSPKLERGCYFARLVRFLKVWRAFVFNCKGTLAVNSVNVAIVTVQWLAIPSSPCSF